MSHVANYELWLIRKISANGQNLDEFYLVQLGGFLKYPTCPYVQRKKNTDPEYRYRLNYLEGTKAIGLISGYVGIGIKKFATSPM